jgi:hypothetical protein
MPKKVRTFTVDVEPYDALVALFKEHKAKQAYHSVWTGT